MAGSTSQIHSYNVRPMAFSLRHPALTDDVFHPNVCKTCFFGVKVTSTDGNASNTTDQVRRGGKARTNMLLLSLYGQIKANLTSVMCNGCGHWCHFRLCSLLQLNRKTHSTPYILTYNNVNNVHNYKNASHSNGNILLSNNSVLN